MFEPLQIRPDRSIPWYQNLQLMLKCPDLSNGIYHNSARLIRPYEKLQGTFIWIIANQIPQ